MYASGIFQPELVHHRFHHTLLVRRVTGSAQVIVSGMHRTWIPGSMVHLGTSLDINDHVVVWLPNCVRLFTTPWNAARQTSLSLTISPEFAQVHVHCISDTIQPSHPLLPSSPTFKLPSIRVFPNELAVHIKWYIQSIPWGLDPIWAQNRSVCLATRFLEGKVYPTVGKLF